MSFNEWKECKIGDVADILSGYAFKTNDFIEEGIPVVKIKNIVSPIVDISDTQYVSEELYKEKIRYSLEYNDILISMTGSHINQLASAVGKIGRVKLVNQKLLLNQRVGKLYVKDPLKCNQEYLYYFFTQDNIRYDLAASAGGSANQANISPQNIRDIDILLPSLQEQKAIASILSSLDEKIELNNQMNKTLEEMAQALFKRWFVEFEFPNEDGESYKSSGGEMVDSELGMIPKGWNVGALDQIAEFLNGLAMQKFRPTEEEDSLPVLKIKELNQGKTDSSSDRCKKSIQENYIINDGDIIFSWSGSLNVKIWCGGQAGLNQHLFKVTSSKYSKWFYYMWIQQYLETFIRIAADKATTMGHIKRQHLSDAKVLIPNKRVLESMNNPFTCIINKLIELNIENRTLVDLRDTLLPKLMSGEIRVSDIEN